MPRDKVFVSYSQRDLKWCEAVRQMTDPLAHSGLFLLWIDRREIEAGDLWREKIRQALGTARVGVLLVSKNFLDSKFIRKIELPELLRSARANEAKLCWLLLSKCSYEREDFAEYQAAHDLAQPLDQLSPLDLLESLVQIREAIQKLAAAPDSLAPWHQESNKDAFVRGVETVVNTRRQNLQDSQPLEYLAKRGMQLALVFFGVAVVEFVRHEFAPALWVVLIALILVVIAPVTRIGLEILKDQLSRAYLLRSELATVTGAERAGLERTATDMIRKHLHVPLQ
jgi:TIR domain